MNHKNVIRVAVVLLVMVLASSFVSEPLAEKYTPAGTWEYAVPGVQPGYENGSMIIAEEGKDYKVTMVLNEYFKTEAEQVVYKKKAISFSVFVENEEVKVNGNFEGDEFKGRLSYFEGDFDITAKRTAK